MQNPIFKKPTAEKPIIIWYGISRFINASNKMYRKRYNREQSSSRQFGHSNYDNADNE